MDDLLTCAEAFKEWNAIKVDDKEKYFNSSTYEDVLRDVSSIQSRQLLTKTMMNLKRLEPFLTGMAHLEKTLTSIKCQETPRIMSCVWGPIRFLLKVGLALVFRTNEYIQLLLTHDMRRLLLKRKRHLTA